MEIQNKVRIVQPIGLARIMELVQRVKHRNLILRRSREVQGNSQEWGITIGGNPLCAMVVECVARSKVQELYATKVDITIGDLWDSEANVRKLIVLQELFEENPMRQIVIIYSTRLVDMDVGEWIGAKDDI